MLWFWRRAREQEAVDVAEVLEAENNRLREAVRVRDGRYATACELIRALRDVNADLDRQLQEATHGQG